LVDLPQEHFFSQPLINTYPTNSSELKQEKNNMFEKRTLNNVNILSLLLSGGSLSSFSLGPCPKNREEEDRSPRPDLIGISEIGI
jgi:hypothetical protein